MMFELLNKLKLFLIVTVTGFCLLLSGLVNLYSNDDLLSLTVFALSLFILSFIAITIYQASARTLLFNFQEKRTDSLDSDRVTVRIQQQVLSSLFSSWSAPIVVFDQNGFLVFFNRQLAEQVSTPLCRGMATHECGFTKLEQQWHHPDLSKKWSIESFSLPLNGALVITASNIGQQLQSVKKQSENDLIRILSHELNNSITPIASLADTLLHAEKLDVEQVNLVLTRIKSRSERLLEFVQSYASLSRLPTPQICRFSLRDMTYDIAKEQGIKLHYKGLNFCYADPILFEQLLINLFKNSHEACNNDCQITVINDQKGHYQQLRLLDNGTGFANLDNAITPLYTTKKEGQGLGLSLCADIVSQHQGTMTLENTSFGASIFIELPLIRS